jgi:uncharacterized protein (DUF1330 family)
MADGSSKPCYQYYLKQVEKIFENTKVGSILYYGESEDFLIGPQDEKWDAIILVEYASLDVFVDFVKSEAYQKIRGHRKASLEDSRLLPASNVTAE